MNAVPDTLSRHQVAIALGERSYEISIGAGLLADPASWADLPRSASALIVTNATVAPLYAPQLERALAMRPDLVTLFAGTNDMSGLPEPAMPAGWGYSYLDWMGAYGFAKALLGALYYRSVTGKGQRIDA